MRLRGKSISFLLICVIVSVVFHGYKLNKRDTYFEDAEIKEWSRNCDTGVCFQTVAYITSNGRFGRIYIYDQPRFLIGDVITLSCKDSMPFTLIGYRQYDTSHKPPICEFEMVKKKYGRRYEEPDDS